MKSSTNKSNVDRRAARLRVQESNLQQAIDQMMESSLRYGKFIWGLAPPTRKFVRERYVSQPSTPKADIRPAAERAEDWDLIAAGTNPANPEPARNVALRELADRQIARLVLSLESGTQV